MTVDAIPRRCRLEANTPIELDIRKIIHDIEFLEADPLLTEAVDLLTQAREKIADYIDS